MGDVDGVNDCCGVGEVLVVMSVSESVCMIGTEVTSMGGQGTGIESCELETIRGIDRS